MSPVNDLMRFGFLSVLSVVISCGCAPVQFDSSAAGRAACVAHLEACFDSAEQMMGQSPPRYDEARALFEFGCAALHSTACVRLGDVFVSGVTGQVAEDRAEEAYRKACELGHAGGCTRAGSMVLIRDDSRLERAAPLFEKACQLSDPLGCLNLAAVLESGYQSQGELSQPDQLVARAKALLLDECENGDGTACRELGMLEMKGKGPVEGMAAATPLFEKGCTHGDGKACTSLAMCYRQGQGVAQDDAKATELFQLGCDLHDGAGCAYLGMFKGQVEEKVEEAFALYNRGCEMASGVACYQVGVSYGLGLGAPIDQQSAADFYRRSCQFRFLGGCNALGRLLQSGEGVTQDFAAALNHYSKVCDGIGWCNTGDCIQAIADGCNNLGALYSQGIGVAADESRAVAYYRKGCRFGYQLACENAARSEASQTVEATPSAPNIENPEFKLTPERVTALVNLTPGRHYLSRSRSVPDFANPMVNCELERPESCFSYGSLCEQGRGVEQSFAKARQHYQFACDREIALACYNLGIFHTQGKGVPINYERAFHFFEKACRLGDAQGCREIGFLFEKGLGTDPDPSAAERIYGAACDTGDMQACSNLALMMFTRNPPQFRHAINLFRRSCYHGYLSACPRYAAARAECGPGARRCIAAAKRGDYEKVEWDRALVENACRKGVTEACIDLAITMEAEAADRGQLDPEVFTLYRRACHRENSAWGCNNLANLYRRGDLVEADMEQATKLYRRACGGGFMLSCADLGRHLIHERASRAELDQGISLLKRSCKNGDSTACVDFFSLCEFGVEETCAQQIE